MSNTRQFSSNLKWITDKIYFKNMPEHIEKANELISAELSNHNIAEDRHIWKKVGTGIYLSCIVYWPLGRQAVPESNVPFRKAVVVEIPHRT